MVVFRRGLHYHPWADAKTSLAVILADSKVFKTSYLKFWAGSKKAMLSSNNVDHANHVSPQQDMTWLSW